MRALINQNGIRGNEKFELFMKTMKDDDLEEYE